MADTEKNVNTEAETVDTTTSNPENQSTTPAENQTQAYHAPEHKKGFWEGVFNFAKMIFVTPFALIARIAQRLALGKEGAQKADEEAQKEYEKHEERKADKKIAVSMEQDAKSIVHELNQDPAYSANPLSIKDIEIYVPDTGRQDLRFAINVTLQNNTTYNTKSAKDYSMYINGNGQLVANKIVPPQVIKQVQDLLEKIQLDVREGQTPDEPETVAEQETHTPERPDAAEEHHNDGTPPESTETTPKTSAPFFQVTHLPDEHTIINGTYEGHSITITPSAQNSLQATLTYNNDTYTCTYNSDAKAIEITGDDLSKLGSAEARILIAQATHRVFDDVIQADWSAKDTGHFETNGGFTCTTVGNQIHNALNDAGAPKKNALYVVPDLAAGDIVIDVQYAAATKNGQPTGQFNAYAHLYAVREQDGVVSITQSANDEKGKNPSNLKFAANNSSVAISGLEISRRLAFSYAQTANLPEMQVLFSGNILYVAHESSKGPSIALFSGCCGYDKNEIATETLVQLYQPVNEGSLDTFTRPFVNVCESNPHMNCYGMHDNIIYHMHCDENGIPYLSGQDIATGRIVTAALDQFEGNNKVAAAVHAIHDDIHPMEQGKDGTELGTSNDDPPAFLDDDEIDEP